MLRNTPIAAFCMSKELVDVQEAEVEQYLHDFSLEFKTSIIVVKSGPVGDLLCQLRDMHGRYTPISQEEIYDNLDQKINMPGFFLVDPRANDNRMVAIYDLVQYPFYNKPVPKECLMVLSNGLVISKLDKIVEGRKITIGDKKCSVRSIAVHAAYGNPLTVLHTVDHANGDDTDQRIANTAWADKIRQRRNQKPHKPRVKIHFSEFGIARSDLTEYEYEKGKKIYVCLHPSLEQQAALEYYQPMFDSAGFVLGTLKTRVDGIHKYVEVQLNFESYKGHAVILAAHLKKFIADLHREMHIADPRLVVRHLRGTPHACDVSDLALGTDFQNMGDMTEFERVAMYAKTTKSKGKPLEISFTLSAGGGMEWKLFESVREAERKTLLDQSILCKMRKLSANDKCSEVAWPESGMYSAVKVRAVLHNNERPAPPGTIAWVVTPALAKSILAHSAAHFGSRESIKRKFADIAAIAETEVLAN